VLAIEASRFARNGRDWHMLIEFCGLVGTILVDEDGICDPRHPNDRLLLGMKGTMSELELSLFRQRSQEALRQKAKRGALSLIAEFLAPLKFANDARITGRGDKCREPVKARHNRVLDNRPPGGRLRGLFCAWCGGELGNPHAQLHGPAAAPRHRAGAMEVLSADASLQRDRQLGLGTETRKHRTMALNAAHSSGSDRQLAPRDVAFGKLPNSVIRNPLVSAGDLVMIAYRCTFGDDERGYGLNPTVLKGIVRSGFGRETTALREFEAITRITKGDESVAAKSEVVVGCHPRHPHDVAISDHALLGWLHDDFGCNLAERADMTYADEDKIAALEEYRPGQHLNSLALIGKRIIAEVFGGAGDHIGPLYRSDAPPMFHLPPGVPATYDADAADSG
jgi:hypothetical protein